MSNEIDWSKAPEGAQAYMPANDQWFEGWWKMVGAQSYFWAANGGENSRWEASNARPWDFRLLVKRPAEPAWNGTGLPPVGTVCEYAGSMEGLKPGDTVEIIYHFNAGMAEAAAFLYWNRGGRYVGQAIADCFRHIRTPEQIAAEDRENAIREMRHIAEHDAHSRTVDYGALYDAGYRKTEAGK